MTPGNRPCRCCASGRCARRTAPARSRCRPCATSTSTFARRVRRPARPVGQRQVHAAQHPRRARPAQPPARSVLRPPSDRRERRRADALPARARRLRVPVLQPDPEPDRARERRAGHRHRRRPDAGRRSDRPRRPDAAARPLPGAAVRRRAAARRDRARHRQAPGRAAVRRADRRARLRRPASWCWR